MIRGLWLLVVVFVAVAAEPTSITPFSSSPPGTVFPTAWQPLLIPNLKPPEFTLVADEGRTVMRVRSVAAAGSFGHRLAVEPTERPILAWRWKVDRVLEKADLLSKEGDDYAARVYVTFDVPESDLTITQRARMAIAKLVYGAELPTAAICYVWDNRNPVGTSVWNPYTDRVRLIVLKSGPAQAGQWAAESRDVEADFRAAFGDSWKKPTPRISGVAVSADTDQTGESVTAWFGDLRLEARR
ncbi:DUF3047 domain-containing protein [Usitatibacter palustris]|uniref:DUF3047 domain-containing protein n=1 Tax=Usitatibacter palustris TaxID=2732487 RepID=A0A6M4HA29_9PROT|nr:DUF3047 domain-containing protein [Usitatibacter palustris]QJR16639.1 hypothetical protein DSM104440_03474 [Usitatibacter palustris]